MNYDNWRYGEASPEFGKADEFKAWIAGSADSRKSAAAWVVCSPLRQASPVVKSSDGTSTAQRAVLAALIGVLESLPPGSSVDCYTNSTYAISAVEKLRLWKAQGWEGTGGPLANREMLQRIDHVMDSRGLLVRMHLVTKQHPECARIAQLTKLARSALHS